MTAGWRGMIRTVLAGRPAGAGAHPAVPAEPEPPVWAGRPKDLRKALQGYLTRAAELRERCLRPDAHPPVHQAEDWVDDLREFLRASGNGARLDRLMQDQTDDAPVPPHEGLSPPQARLLAWLDGRCARIRDFMAELD